MKRKPDLFTYLSTGNVDSFEKAFVSNDLGQSLNQVSELMRPKEQSPGTLCPAPGKESEDNG